MVDYQDRVYFLFQFFMQLLSKIHLIFLFGLINVFLISLKVIFDKSFFFFLYKYLFLKLNTN